MVVSTLRASSTGVGNHVEVPWALNRHALDSLQPVTGKTAGTLRGPVNGAIDPHGGEAVDASAFEGLAERVAKDGVAPTSDFRPVIAFFAGVTINPEIFPANLRRAKGVGFPGIVAGVVFRARLARRAFMIDNVLVDPTFDHSALPSLGTVPLPICSTFNAWPALKTGRTLEVAGRQVGCVAAQQDVVQNVFGVLDDGGKGVQPEGFDVALGFDAGLDAPGS